MKRQQCKSYKPGIRFFKNNFSQKNLHVMQTEGL